MTPDSEVDGRVEALRVDVAYLSLIVERLAEALHVMAGSEGYGSLAEDDRRAIGEMALVLIPRNLATRRAGSLEPDAPFVIQAEVPVAAIPLQDDVHLALFNAGVSSVGDLRSWMSREGFGTFDPTGEKLRVMRGFTILQR